MNRLASRIMSLALAGALCLPSMALGAEVLQGTLTVLDEVSDLDLTGIFPYAINAGGSVYSGNPVGNPYSGGVWGSTLESSGADKQVGDAVFKSDMWNCFNEGKSWNRSVANTLSDGATFGSGFDDWRYYPERGTRYHGIGGGYNDGGLGGFANYVSGYQNENRLWQSPYEGRHDTDAGQMFPGDSSQDAENLRTILARSGAQNLGGYRAEEARGERDMTFEFDVVPTYTYKVQLLFFKNNFEATGMRVDVNGTTVVDKLNLLTDITDHARQGLVYSYQFVAADSLLQIKIGRRTDDGGSNIGDINGITVEEVSRPQGIFPKATNPLPADLSRVAPSLYAVEWTNPAPKQQGDTVTVDVLFADNINMTNATVLLQDSTAQSVAVPALQVGQTGYWRVDSTDSNQGSPVTTQGDVWQFTVDPSVAEGMLQTVTRLSQIDLTGQMTYAINAGAAVYSDAPAGDPFNGGSWGTTPTGDDNLAVGDATFLADVWNNNTDATNFNIAAPLSDGALFGSGFDYSRYRVERGALYHGAGGGGSDDGGIAGLGNYLAGFDPTTAIWQCGYADLITVDTGDLFAGDASTDANNLRTVLARGGQQNVGTYNGTTGERDLAYDFAVDAGQEYRIQILGYSDRNTDNRVDVEGATVLDKVNFRPAASDQIVLYTDTLVAPDNILNVRIGRRTDNAGSYDAVVSAITVEHIPSSGKATNPVPRDGTDAGCRLPQLKWKNPTPQQPGGTVTVDVFVSQNADMSGSTQILAGSAASSVAIPPPVLAGGQTWYWRVDSHDSDAGLITGDVWSFTVTEASPVVDAGAPQTGYLNPPAPDVVLTLDGSVTVNTCSGAATILWTVDSGPAAVTFLDSSDPATTATFTTTGQYVLRLTANDGVNPPVSDTVDITILGGARANVGQFVLLDELSDLDMTGNVEYAIDCNALPNGQFDFVLQGATFKSDFLYRAQYLPDDDLNGNGNINWWDDLYQASRHPLTGTITGFAINGSDGLTNGYNHGIYEGAHNVNTDQFFGGLGSRSPQEEILAMILATSGAQNIGGRGERNMCYHFAVRPNARYRIQMMFLKKGETSSAGIWIRPNGVVLTRGDESGYIGWNTAETAAVEALDIEHEIKRLGGTPDTAALLWTAEVDTDIDGSLDLEIARWWDGDYGRVGGPIKPEDPTGNVMDVSGIVITYLSGGNQDGDLDGDGDADAADFAVLQRCLGDVSGLPWGDICRSADLDGSGAVDDGDIEVFVDCATGPAIPVDAQCFSAP